MYHGNLVVQRIRKVPSASLRATGIVPTLLHVCCICGHIREETGTSANREHWVTQRTYRHTHCVKLANSLLTHTYCPKCYAKFMDTLRQYVREHGTPP
jgi:hypothetical protein